MNLSKNQKIVIGIVTLVPFILIPYFLIQIVFFVMEMVAHQPHEPNPATIFAGIASFLIPIIITGVISFGLLIFYIIHAINNKSINGTEQLIWILVFIFIGTIGFPIYWVLRIWNAKET
jgi:hypothetical protein